jgi:hypothetical protein
MLEEPDEASAQALVLSPSHSNLAFDILLIESITVTGGTQSTGRRRRIPSQETKKL